MFRRDPEIARDELIEVARRQRGVIAAMGHDLNVSRRHVYRLVYRAGVWEEVERARQLSEESDVPEEIRLARLLV
jgi:hypothetical protein